jgi:transposase-like protein
MPEALGEMFKGRHFTSEVISWPLRWHRAFPISWRDPALMLPGRSAKVGRNTPFR